MIPALPSNWTSSPVDSPLTNPLSVQRPQRTPTVHASPLLQVRRHPGKKRSSREPHETDPWDWHIYLHFWLIFMVNGWGTVVVDTGAFGFMYLPKWGNYSPSPGFPPEIFEVPFPFQNATEIGGGPGRFVRLR